MLPGLAGIYACIAEELWLLGRAMAYPARTYVLLFSLVLSIAHLAFWLVPVRKRPAALYKVSLYGTMIYVAIFFNWICFRYGLHLFDGDLWTGNTWLPSLPERAKDNETNIAMWNGRTSGLGPETRPVC